RGAGTAAPRAAEPRSDLPRPFHSRGAAVAAGQAGRGHPAGAAEPAVAGCRAAVPAPYQGGLRGSAEFHGAPGHTAGRGPAEFLAELPGGGAATGGRGEGRQASAEESRSLSSQGGIAGTRRLRPAAADPARGREWTGSVGSVGISGR